MIRKVLPCRNPTIIAEYVFHNSAASMLIQMHICEINLQTLSINTLSYKYF